MIDQLIIGDKASFDDFCASVASRSIGVPPKKSIKETVPFSNVTYDFSKIDGELFWEERKLEYVFEIIAPTPEELEELKTAFTKWLMNVFEEKLFDPFIPDYHFLATYEDMKFDDEDGMDKTTATVTFMAYPYKIANHGTVFKVELAANGEGTLTFVNNSAHKVAATLTTDGEVNMKFGDSWEAMSAGTYALSKIETGPTSIPLQNLSASVCTVSVCFNEEVF